MIFNKFKHTIKRYGLLSGGETVVVGASGGVDSMVLLHLVDRLMKDSGGRVVAAHLHHGLRGEEADRDEAFLRNSAQKMNFPFISKRVDVKGMAAAGRLNLQDAARKARYDFFEDALKEVEGERLVLGHNADDQAETVMMRIIRGTGIKGLSAIPPRRGKIIRPLIDLTREQIVSYAAQHGIEYVEDSSNSETKYMRNRLRHELMPVLRSYNPEISRELTLLSSMARDLEDFIAHEAGKAFDSLVLAGARQSDALCLDIAAFNSLPSPIRGKVVFLALEKVSGSKGGFYSPHIAGIDELISAGKSGSSINLPKHVRLFIEYGKAVFTKETGTELRPFCYELNMSGETKIPEADAALSAAMVDFHAGMLEHDRSKSVYLDMDKISSTLRVRNFRAGDRVKLQGMTGRKKLKDFFIDEKIPRRTRKNIPLLVSGDEIQWIAGFRDGGSLLADGATISALKVTKI